MDEATLKSVANHIKTLLSCIKCNACSKIIREPQTGICLHDACARCWGSSGKMCCVCNKSSGARGLKPNEDLSKRVNCVMKLAKTFHTLSGINVISSSSSDSFLDDDKNMSECFIERDQKYSNLKTYKKTRSDSIEQLTSISQADSPIRFTGETIDNSKIINRSCSNVEKKQMVEGWLKAPDNIFIEESQNKNSSVIENVTSKDPSVVVISESKTNINSNEKTKINTSKEKNKKITDNSEILHKFFGTVVPDRPSNQDKNVKLEEKENKKVWEPVKMMKKTLKKTGRPNLKKLNLSIQSDSKKITPKKEINNLFQNLKDKSKISIKESPVKVRNSTLKSPEKIIRCDTKSATDMASVIDLNSSIDKTPTPVDHDALALQEVIAQSRLNDIDHTPADPSKKDTHSMADTSVAVTHLSLQQPDKLQTMKSYLKHLESDSNANTDNVIVNNSKETSDGKPNEPDDNSTGSKIISKEPNKRRSDVNRTRGSITKKKIVPFIYGGKLYNRPKKNIKTVPFIYKTNTSFSRRKTKTNCLNLKIEGNNTYTSIVIRSEGNASHRVSAVQTRDMWTSPVRLSSHSGNKVCEIVQHDNQGMIVTTKCTNAPCDEITNSIERELKENNLCMEEDVDIFGTHFSNNANTQSVQPPTREGSDILLFQKDKKNNASAKSLNKSKLNQSPSKSQGLILEKDNVSQVSTPRNGSRSYKRLRGEETDKSLDDSAHNISKKKRVSTHSLIDDNIVVQFESQIDASNNSINNIDKSNGRLNSSAPKVSQDVIEDSEKITKLKKSIYLYEGRTVPTKVNEPLPHCSKDSYQSPRKSSFVQAKEVESQRGSSKNKPSSQRNSQVELNDIEKADFLSQRDNIDSSGSVVVETPQKMSSFKVTKKLQNSKEESAENKNILSDKGLADVFAPANNVEESGKKNMIEDDFFGLTPDMVTERDGSSSSKKLSASKGTKYMETPANMNQFTSNIKHRSTPHHVPARRSLQYNNIPTILEGTDDAVSRREKSCDATQNTNVYLEKEFMEQAFQNSQIESKSPTRSTLRTPKSKASPKKINVSPKYKLKDVCVVCTCLTVKQKDFLKQKCSVFGWKFSEDFTDQVTHVIVKVDGKNQAQRTLKYIQGVVSGCWVLNWDWVVECSKAKRQITESPFEVLDSFGDRGPYLSRMMKTRIFSGMKFFCDPPFSILTVEGIKDVLTRGGGEIVDTIEEICIKNPRDISILIGEPDDTQDDRYSLVCMKYPIVPVNMEWILDTVGKGKMENISEWLICHRSLLPKIDWPADVFSAEDTEEE